MRYFVEYLERRETKWCNTKKEMIFVGGGAGMAPMRSHIFDQMKRINTDRKVTFWYGARSSREVFYEEEFRAIEREFPNFKFRSVLFARQSARSDVRCRQRLQPLVQN